MTREEAREMLKALNTMLRNPDGEPISDVCEAIDMAIDDIERWRTWSHTYDNLIRREDAIEALDMLPSADAVEVVRCKDCRHWNSETNGCKRNPSVEAWYETDFCRYGERRTK